MTLEMGLTACIHRQTMGLLMRLTLLLASVIYRDLSFSYLPIQKLTLRRRVDFDIEVLKSKQDSGASAAITQFFFNNDDFFRYRDRAATAGVTMPIIPGIMVPENIKAFCALPRPVVLRFLLACPRNLQGLRMTKRPGVSSQRTSRSSSVSSWLLQV